MVGWQNARDVCGLAAPDLSNGWYPADSTLLRGLRVQGGSCEPGFSRGVTLVPSVQTVRPGTCSSGSHSGFPAVLLAPAQPAVALV